MSSQARMVLAMVLSFLFFVVYEYFMPQPNLQTLNEANRTQSTIQHTSTAAPSAIDTVHYAAPMHDAQAAPVSTSTSKQAVISVVDSEKFRATFDALGRISKYEVLIERFKDEEGGYPDIISSANPLKPLEIRFSDAALNEEAFKTPYVADHDTLSITDGSEVLTLTQTLSSTTVNKKITFNKDGSYTLNITLSNDIPYFISPGFRPDEAEDMYTFQGVLIRKSEGTTETIEDGDAEGNEIFRGATIAASSDKYYTTSFYNFDDGLNAYISKDSEDDPLLFVKGSAAFQTNGYIGAKEYDALHAIDPRMTDIIEYGFFTFIAKPVFIFLKYIHGIVGNWGWAIIILTILFKLILFPLTYKGMVSMNKLKALSPKIKEIQKKYKGNPQQLNAKTMEFYKKHNANPMGGCLPMLLQIPIFFSVYRVLLNTIELKHAPWTAWITDLSVMDPYYVLPILMGATMFWSQSITPTNFTDPMQEKVMKFLPLIFTFFFITFPAGLTLYWVTNSLFQVAQQYYVNSIFSPDGTKKGEGEVS